MEPERIDAAEFDRLVGLDDWRYVLGMVVAEFDLPTFPQAAGLVSAIAVAAEAAGHHPDLQLTYPGVVRVQMKTHAVDGLTTLDVELARTISALAEAMCAAARPTEVWDLELALDTMDADRIRPFWRAILGYDADAQGNLVDPQRRGPALWFQQMDEPRTGRNRFHLDVTVAHDVAEQRVADAIAAGGTLLSNARARAFWVLADADGNEACICTWQDR
ncbi:MAG: pterin-4-alpha-carbinolamine dehydratase [Acidimicrobiaceae bacterium]|nr:pterin-4-alpha-carbinolamine dehydratase [Acidimicrobiaceae bacterium]